MSVDVLVDTHVLVWWSIGDIRWERLLGNVLEDDASTVTVSAVSWAEIAIKKSLGKMKLDLSLLRESARLHGFIELTLSGDHAEQLATLPLHHGDPFDRILIAQAMTEGMAIATADRAFEMYDGLRLHRP